MSYYPPAWRDSLENREFFRYLLERVIEKEIMAKPKDGEKITAKQKEKQERMTSFLHMVAGQAPDSSVFREEKMLRALAHEGGGNHDGDELSQSSPSSEWEGYIAGISRLILYSESHFFRQYYAREMRQSFLQDMRVIMTIIYCKDWSIFSIFRALAELSQ